MLSWREWRGWSAPEGFLPWARCHLVHIPALYTSHTPLSRQQSSFVCLQVRQNYIPSLGDSSTTMGKKIYCETMRKQKSDNLQWQWQGSTEQKNDGNSTTIRTNMLQCLFFLMPSTSTLHLGSICESRATCDSPSCSLSSTWRLQGSLWWNIQWKCGSLLHLHHECNHIMIANTLNFASTTGKHFV